MKNILILCGLMLLFQANTTRPVTTLNVVTTTSSLTLNSTHDVVICEATTPITITLPNPVGVAGQKYTIVNHGTAVVNLSWPITVANAETMSSITYSMGGNLYTIVSNNQKWHLTQQ
jgi:hypothetical protein